MGRANKEAVWDERELMGVYLLQQGDLKSQDHR